MSQSLESCGTTWRCQKSRGHLTRGSCGSARLQQALTERVPAHEWVMEWVRGGRAARAAAMDGPASLALDQRRFCQGEEKVCLLQFWRISGVLSKRYLRVFRGGIVSPWVQFSKIRFRVWMYQDTLPYWVGPEIPTGGNGDPRGRVVEGHARLSRTGCESVCVQNGECSLWPSSPCRTASSCQPETGVSAGLMRGTGLCVIYPPES